MLPQDPENPFTIKNMKLPFQCISIDLKETNQFSSLITDYIGNHKLVEEFYSYPPVIEAFKDVIFQKENDFVNRLILTNVVIKQYDKISVEDKGDILDVINTLKEKNTFTITTGHQLCVFTGPLYFIYKIISTINTAKKLKSAYPDYNFIPVYWMASEDHDFEEINHIHLYSKKISWQQEQKGACGRINTHTLTDFFRELSEISGNSVHAEFIKQLFEKAYLHNYNLADATRILVHEIFGKQGLLILDADDAELKRAFIPYMEDDILNHHAFNKVNETNSKLEVNYTIQVKPREINLFYLADGLRERIIKTEKNTYRVNNTDITFSQSEIIQLLKSKPELFSPNVVLRPLYQEVILPNLAYIGGPGEIAYWLQLKNMFDFYKVPFPVLMLRNCLLFLEKDMQNKLNEFNLKLPEIFMDLEELVKHFLTNNTNGIETVNFETEKENLHLIYESLKNTSGNIDATLIPFIAGEHQKSLNAILLLEQKITKAQKRKHEVAINQLKKIKEKLFPDSVPQERHYNFAMLYLYYGNSFLEYLMETLDPFLQKYLIISER